MDIEFLIGVDSIEDRGIIFDSRDYDGIETTLDEIGQDVEDAIQHINNQEKRGGVFLLLSAPSCCSIVDIFRKIRESANKNSVQDLKICVNSQKVVEHLQDNIPPFEPLTCEIHNGDKTLLICTGDISEIMTDAIVNASNTRLILGGGVSGAIHKKAGPDLQMEMSRIARSRPMKPGDAVMTGAFGLKTCSRIIHAATVDGSEKTVLNAVKNCMRICSENRIKSVVFPALGTGTGGLHLEKCAEITCDEIFKFWQNNPQARPDTVIVVLQTKKAFDLFRDHAEQSWHMM